MTSLAIKRLTKDLRELKKNPLSGTNAEPLNSDNLLIWHCTTIGPEDTPYDDVPIHWVMEFSNKYPLEPPNAYFITEFPTRAGSTNRDSKGRMYVCMNIFSNYSSYHSEWVRVKEGWSSTMTVSTILVQFQASLADSNFISLDSSSVASTRKKCQSFRCSECGHDGSSPKKWKPEFPLYKSDTKTPLIKKPKLSLSLSRKDQQSSSSAAATTDETEQISKEEQDRIKSNVMCVITHQSLADDQETIFGFGFNFNNNENERNSNSSARHDCNCGTCQAIRQRHQDGSRRNIITKIWTPFEYLSHEGYKTGARSSFKDKITEWFPIYLNEEHWHRAKPQFDQQLVKLLKSPEDPKELLEFFAKLMRSLFEGNRTINEAFTQGYFTFFRTLLTYRDQLTDYLQENIFNLTTFWAIEDFSEFIDNSESPLKNINRMSTWMLAIMLLNPPWEIELKTAFLREFRARKVSRTYRKLQISPSETDFESIDQRLFKDMKNSIEIICFQLAFWQIVREIDFDQLETRSNILSEDDIQLLMIMYREIRQISNWREFYTWFACSPDEELEKQRRTILDIQDYYQTKKDEEEPEQHSTLFSGEFSERRINQILDGMEKNPTFMLECPDAATEGHECGGFICYDKWDRLVNQARQKAQQQLEKEERQRQEEEELQRQAEEERQQMEEEKKRLQEEEEKKREEEEERREMLRMRLLAQDENWLDVLKEHQEIMNQDQPDGDVLALAEREMLEYERIERRILLEEKLKLERAEREEREQERRYQDERDLWERRREIDFMVQREKAEKAAYREMFERQEEMVRKQRVALAEIIDQNDPNYELLDEMEMLNILLMDQFAKKQIEPEKPEEEKFDLEKFKEDLDF